MAGKITVHVLGTGCEKCDKLYTETQIAIAEADVEVELKKVENIEEIASFGVVMTPGLVIDGTVRSAGKIPKSHKIVAWLLKAQK